MRSRGLRELNHLFILQEEKIQGKSRGLREVGPPFFILFLTKEKEEKKFKLGGCYEWYRKMQRKGPLRIRKS